MMVTVVVVVVERKVEGLAEVLRVGTLFWNHGGTKRERA